MLVMSRRRVAIVGASLSDCGKVEDKTFLQLMAQAARRAIADAGLTKRDVTGLGALEGLTPPVDLAEYLGISPTWVNSTKVGGSTWEVMAQHAVDAIAAGKTEVVVLTYASTVRSDLKAGRGVVQQTHALPDTGVYEQAYRPTLIGRYAMAAKRHMHQYGTTAEQLAEIAVAMRANAATNPMAQYRTPITVEDVQSAQMMADPFTTLHCCIRSDGGGAVVLASEAVARQCRKKPVWILGAGHAVSHVSMSQWPDFTRSACEKSGAIAFGEAGIKPAEVDVAQIYDSFTYTVLAALEGLGFCAPGEGGAFVANGALKADGRLPTNTDGGGLSACHPGQRGIFLLVEAVRQLRNEAGEGQVADAKLCCVNGTGGFMSSTGTMILGAD
jgi:acetyl-CoA acetyltransferase